MKYFYPIPPMKKFTSWPPPPQFFHKLPPKIPETYTIFGLTFKVKDNNPYLDPNEEQEFSREVTRGYMSASIGLYKEIIKCIIDGEDISNKVTQLNDLHREVNNYLSKCRKEEVKIVQENENKKIKENRERLLKELDEMMK